MLRYEIATLVLAIISFIESCILLWPRLIKNRGPSIEFLLAFCRDKWRHGFDSAWAKLISRTKSRSDALIVLGKFIETYDSEQRSSIEQENMVTTFEAYSAFVSATIEKVREIAPKSSRVYGITTLALPIVQWQNFGRIGYAERLSFFEGKHTGLPYHFNKANQKWNTYLDFLADLFWEPEDPSKPQTTYVRKQTPLSLFRYIISISPSVIEFLERNNFPWAKEIYGQRSSEEAKTQLCSWILCSRANRPLCIPSDSIRSIFDLLTFDPGYNRSEIIDFYATNHEQNGSSYIIVPPGAVVQPSFKNALNLCWRRLGDVFAELYQDRSQNLFLTTIDDIAYKEYYIPESKKPLPQDFFLIGIGPPRLEKDEDIFDVQKVNWVFGLSAHDMDRELSKLKLSFFVREWRTGRSQLDNILEFGRKVLAPPKGTVHERPQLGSVCVQNLVMSAECAVKPKESHISESK